MINFQYRLYQENNKKNIHNLTLIHFKISIKAQFSGSMRSCMNHLNTDTASIPGYNFLVKNKLKYTSFIPDIIHPCYKFLVKNSSHP